jgi:hypothetical protein
MLGRMALVPTPFVCLPVGCMVVCFGHAVRDREGRSQLPEGVKAVFVQDGSQLSCKRGGVLSIPGNSYPPRYLTVHKDLGSAVRDL